MLWVWLTGVKGHMVCVCVSVYSLYSDWSGGGRGPTGLGGGYS